MDWLHCNTCFHQPGDGGKFLLTSCGHIYCEKCIDQVTNGKCKMCGSVCTTIPLSGQMKPDVELFFTNPMDLLKKEFRKIIQVMDFQHNQRRRFFSYLMDKLHRQQNVMEKCHKAIRASQDLERDMSKLREENSYLKRLMSERENRHITSATSRSHGRRSGNSSPIYRGSPSSSPQMAVASRSQSQNQNSQTGSHASFIALPRNVNAYTTLGSTVGRVSVRTPPSGGRIGTVGNTPSPRGYTVPVTPKSVPHPIAFGSLLTPSPM
ncbi:RING finger protein 212B-like [Pecten maximus]|uniref:RING finger protein 212B-like n=1 Tax=Pecten maximus TaxID=6579 RepID=UPI001458FDAD|nr:RING finger protein 212B-like [Pecten maximus]XP_033763507.1 RING finger protein 212B-like [Pecten maximus]